MSFSRKVKEEIVDVHISARHCQISMLLSMIWFCGKVSINLEKNHVFLTIQTENLLLARKCFTLLKKAFKIYSRLTVRQVMNQTHNFSYLITIEKRSDVEQLLQILKWHESINEIIKGNGVLHNSQKQITLKCDVLPINELLIKGQCCKRSFLRGAYLAAGSMSDPEKSYHLEFLCQQKEQAEQMISVLAECSMEAKMVLRKKYYVVYIKEGESIVLLLNLMEAHISLMDLENTRILKEMRNSINRKVNCETANIAKTVNAANKQLADIRLLQEHGMLDHLPDNLRQVALVRMEYPDVSLKELGEMLEPKVGKSGVNHRLRKLTEIADRLKV